MSGYRRVNELRGDGSTRGRRLAVGTGVLLGLLATLFVVFASSAAGAGASMTLTPASATNLVGQQHCVTATVTGANSPTFVVEFTTATTSGTAVAVPADAVVPADQNAQAQFCFTSATPGQILITAVARATNTMSRPTATATKTFVEAFPTGKDQCKDDGWQTFGVFKNQGDCVSFVATGGKNSPAG